MINPFQMMSNPNQFINQQLQNKMNAMMQQNPQAFQRMKEMTSGKSETEMKQTAINLAKERGVDIQQFAKNFGITI